ncbi:hypothetical protein [Psittacicella gerlachiana]|uniref:Uncharacterized protein n=1 Tax=Psittacicella gerlachiana TaxID=2028574 RepID=A0A3A1YA00_9GAMM|nr:hypothetical protein [Psittacicella gerlachiana]RIY34018.1 hypothetical protein CKF59_05855 [Psittacicella gerlachiana]
MNSDLFSSESRLAEKIENLVKKQYDLRLEIMDSEQLGEDNPETEQLLDNLLEIKDKATTLIEDKNDLIFGYTLGIGKKYMQVRQNYLDLAQKAEPNNAQTYAQETEINIKSAQMLLSYREKIVELQELEKLVKAEKELQDIDSENNTKIIEVLEEKGFHYNDSKVFEDELQTLVKNRKSNSGLYQVITFLVAFFVVLALGIRYIFEVEGISF